MEALFASGRVIDAAIVLLALEVLLVHGWLRRPTVLPVPTLVAGLGLLFAWRFQAAGWSWMWVAATFTLAGLAHGWDVWQRWLRT
jgi:hypothetical protein